MPADRQDRKTSGGFQLSDIQRFPVISTALHLRVRDRKPPPVFDPTIKITQRIHKSDIKTGRVFCCTGIQPTLLSCSFRHPHPAEAIHAFVLIDYVVLSVNSGSMYGASLIIPQLTAAGYALIAAA
ncbi:hypothetical protein ACO22_06943 [Paracoccidioides brasiliensis]|uniref:Uncharacterized protein n=1 Tax=Paracoccidioides brasiliensis TaxID=121759 RepID=A0A1D2J619_PARBR|nr:hypothetical protein ACO22_06943 [Paracoccidioides brasiliensis]